MSYTFFDVLKLIGALGFFIYGMKVMSDGIQKAAGNKMRQILGAMTSNRFFGLFTGLFITTLVQSSSATTVMVVSFVNAGLLTLVESIGVIMGANIGTTVTSWLISEFGLGQFKIAAIALPIIAFGFPMMFSSKSKIKSWGEVLIGFALLFMGLDELKHSVPDLKSNPEILEFFKGFAYEDKGYLGKTLTSLLFVGVGTLLTIIVQSSSAAMALTLVMTSQGWIPFPLAAAMVLGENIGTTITANLAAMIGNVHAKRAARAHFIFNVFGVVWMLFLFPFFVKGIGSFMENNPGFGETKSREYTIEIPADKVDSFYKQTTSLAVNNPTLVSSAELTNTTDNQYTLVTEYVSLNDESEEDASGEIVSANSADKTTQSKVKDIVSSLGLPASAIVKSKAKGASPFNEAKVVPTSLSIFHTAFNILNVVFLIGFVGFIARIVKRMVPSKGDDDEVFSLEYIGSGLMDTPELSIIEARKELGKFSKIVKKMYSYLPRLLNEVEDKKFSKYNDKVEKYEDITDRTEVEIAAYLAKAASGGLSDDASERVRGMLGAADILETIGDVCLASTRNLNRKRKQKAYFTPELRNNIEDMFALVSKGIDLMVENVNQEPQKVDIEAAQQVESEAKALHKKLRKEYLKNIEKGKINVQSGMYYNDMINELERISHHAYSISLTLKGLK